MAKLVVWYPGPRDDEVFEKLKLSIEPFGNLVRERPPQCDVFIEGRPAVEQLDAIKQGGAVVVPFAGVPPMSIEVLRLRPDLTLHNLHHNGPETSETTLALLLAAFKRIVTADRAMRTGDWTPRYTPEETIRLDGKTALVLGMGSIGKRVATACAAMGMQVIGVRKHGDSPEVQRVEFPSGQACVDTFPMSMFKDLLPQAHALILAIPLTDETKDLIGKEEIEALKKPSFLINAARAHIVKEKDLYEALRDGVLQAAGLDVWYRYPKHPEGIVPGYFNMPDEARHTYPSEYPFHELDNVVMSPHRGGSSLEAEEFRVVHLTELIKAFHDTGKMPNLVDLEAGY
jgi:phosphoglycerate dehydrogenase-like enzyme